MKKFLVLLSLLFSSFAFADTINLHWLNYDGTSYQDSTCVIDSDLILPATPPTRYGYTFTGWKLANFTTIAYLESTGTQYIDTGVKLSDYKNNLIFEADFQIVSLDIGTQILAGVTSGENRYYVLTVGNNKFTSTVSSNNTSTTMTNADNNRHTFISNTNTATAFLDGVSYNYTNANASSPYNITLFAKNDEGRKVDRFSTAKIYRVSMKTADNVLIRDFVPALDENSTPCLYDRVERKFYYNQGTGGFIAGPLI